MKETEQFGANVRVRREAMAISQEELADLAGLHRTYIGSVERGERNVSLMNILRIAAALKCCAADLLDGITLRE
jgi:transcriptional regulator with XRE-family HTH domain